jgi:hypothetical protein
LTGDVAPQIIAEGKRRNWTESETLAVLTLAIDENWQEVPTGFFDRLASQAYLTIDPWYNLAHLRGYPFNQWQTFRLYAHIRAAKALYDNKGDDPLSALTDAEQRELLTKVRAIFDDAHDTRVQLRGPNDAGWAQLGKNSKGQNLSFIDAVGRIKDKLFGTNNAVS